MWLLLPAITRAAMTLTPMNGIAARTLTPVPRWRRGTEVLCIQLFAALSGCSPQSASPTASLREGRQDVPDAGRMTTPPRYAAPPRQRGGRSQQLDRLAATPLVVDRAGEHRQDQGQREREHLDPSQIAAGKRQGRD